MNIVLLGAPGAGKGSQAYKIKAQYNIPHISTGEIFRENMKAQTELGLLAKSYIDGGKLVPDEVVIRLVEDRLKEDDAKGGYILDGFPRTLQQAIALDKITNVDVVINIVVPFEEIEQRLTGRRMCKCGEIYNVCSLNGSEVCSKCGGKLFIRDDDKIETVKARLEVYLDQTAPLIDYYKEKGIIWDIRGRDTAENTFKGTQEVLSKL